MFLTDTQDHFFIEPSKNMEQVVQAENFMIDQYQLFLFDFDGLLVNTEFLHYQAYKKMCANHGFDLDWSFEDYCQIAQFEAHGLEREILAKFPALKEAGWPNLYAEKKQAYLDLASEGEISLMPGAATFIESLVKAGKKLAIVTNSPLEQVSSICETNPVLNKITHWITRENYTKAKPDPECYLKAMELLLEDGEIAVGFEDSPRGLKALKTSGAHCVWVSALRYPQEQEILKDCHQKFKSLQDLNEICFSQQSF